MVELAPMNGRAAAILAGVVALVLVALSIPHRPSTIRQNDSAAVGALRRIQVLQASYAERNPTGFACGLPELNQPGDSSGYTFKISCGAAINGKVLHYQATAEPREPGRTGVDAYCIADTGDVRSAKRGTAAECIATGVPLAIVR